MKYTCGQFTKEYYQLWEMGLLLPVPLQASVYSVKYRKNHFDGYSRVTLKAVSVSDALERACYAITYASPWRPEDVDLHAVYDEEDNLLWLDEPFYDLVQKKNEFRGMERREFLVKFGATIAAILFGLRPAKAHAATTAVALSGTAIGFAGEAIYSPGSYTWTVPASVTSVCVVCVGGGGGGGGSGGCLAYKNSISTTPGQTVSVVVGAGGAGTGSAGVPGGNGGDSSFSTLSAGGGRGNGALGAINGHDGGGIGGKGGAGGGYSGGGAGGYSGAGGDAGDGGNGHTGKAGVGGGGGGGAWAYSSGGGVGLYGIGANGVGGSGSNGSHGTGGSGGATGGFTSGGNYGGAGCGYGSGTQAIVPGGSGAVRIIWGVGRSFPNNAS